MPVILGYTFVKYTSISARVYSVHVDRATLTRKTLSFGFYRRTPNNSLATNDYGFATPFTPVFWVDNWYFGVNFRVKCQQAITIVHPNIAYTDTIAPAFLRSGWTLIPHYVNTHNDQGVDFFKLLPDKLLSGFNPKIDQEGYPTFVWQDLPQDIKDWIAQSIDEALRLI
jgi:hypothetical protein